MKAHIGFDINPNPLKTCLEEYPVSARGSVFYDVKVLLDKQGVNQTEKPFRLIGYQIGGKIYWVATDRFDLTAEQIAQIYKLRWDIETFFAWQKRHLKVYHLISRNPHGLMIQILSGLITYLLLAFYCHNQHGEPVSIKKVWQLRNKRVNESREAESFSLEKKGGSNTIQNSNANP